MPCGLSFVLLVGLFFLVANERGSGLPTNIQANDHGEALTEEEKGHIREVLKLALQELKDEDILHVLRESLTLRFKVCFAPFPPPPPSPEASPDGYGIMRDEEFTPDQKKGLRELLLECLEHIGEQEMLDFLKSSIEFRIQYCPWPGDFLTPNTEPIPDPGAWTTPMPTPKPTTPIPSTTPSEAANVTGTRRVPAYKPGKNWPGKRLTTGGEMATTQAAEVTSDAMPADTPKEVALEDELSAISRRDEIPVPSLEDKPSGAQIIGKDPSAKLAKRLSKKVGALPIPKLSVAKLVSRPKKLSESLVRDPDSSVVEEPVRGGVQPHAIAGEVKKAALQAKEPSSAEIMTANSNEGEFASVMKIDYKELAREEREKHDVVGVDLADLGQIVENDEQLSL